MNRFSIILVVALSGLLFSCCAKKASDEFFDGNKYIGTYEYTETITTTVTVTAKQKETTTETSKGTFRITEDGDSGVAFSGWLPVKGHYQSSTTALILDPITVTESGQKLDYTFAGGGMDAKGKNLTILYAASGTRQVDGHNVRVQIDGRVEAKKK